MTMTSAPPSSAPLLRTLSPALRGLERGLRAWLDGPHRYPLSTIGRATLEGLVADLHRQAEALDVDRPLLIIVLMGGTGVGKSTLLNALAGGAIAQSSFTRPTTRDPVVYYHESIKPDRLPTELRHCRLAPHDRPTLEHKIIVDTPDLDSNEPANRERLKLVLPVADIVLYVGSQEKYHDQIGWQLFLEQRRRRAFAFVLNKWDRCTHVVGAGLRPDEDLLRDLNAQGFEKPLLFRTCARLWLEKGDRDPANTETNGDTSEHEPNAGPAGTNIPEGEQFRDLQRWLEMGLSRLEIEAIKARGVGQLLHQMSEGLSAVCPPDLTEVAARVRSAWSKPLAEESAATADVLLDSLDPYQREIEHHFAIQGQSRFHGMMAAYLHMFTRVRYVGSTLKKRIPFVGAGKAETAPAWDLQKLTQACSDVAANRQLDARARALANRLLLVASEQGFPLGSLADPVEAVGKTDWRQRHSRALSEVLQRVEKQWTKPTGTGRMVQSGLVMVADFLPPLSLLAGVLILLWRLYDPYNVGYQMNLTVMLLPLVVLMSVLVILHLLIVLLMPLRWSSIRGEFGRQLSSRIHDDLDGAYSAAPGDVAATLLQERRQLERLAGETIEVATWLSEREQSASGIEGLYGTT
jgi:energy-coupling factor transporter ATP-binding protein EcfA2